MTEASKNTLAALIVGGGGGGSYALNKYLKSGSEEETKGDQEPGLTLDLNSLLNADINFAPGQDSFSRGYSQPSSINLSTPGSTGYPDKTLGAERKNKVRLVDPNNTANKDWWEWTFKKFEQFKLTRSDFVHSFFSNVSEPYSTFDSSVVGTNNITALNQACHKAYGLKYLDFEPHENLLENIKEFCSTAAGSVRLFEPEDEEPYDISVLNDSNPLPNEYTNKLASYGDNKKHFVSTTNFGTGKENLLWWKWSYKKNFLDKKYIDPTGLASSFREIEKAYSDSSDSKALNKVCESYYRQDDKAVSDVILQSNIRFFCTKGASHQTFIKFDKIEHNWKLYEERKNWQVTAEESYR